MSADLLRRAATAIRELAASATPSPWSALIDGVYVNPEYDDRGWLTYDALVVELESEDDEPTADAEHIASWHPAVALTLADWLEEEAAAVEFDGASRSDLLMPSALHFACTYLGETEL